jgi:hypothetical protein
VLEAAFGTAKISTAARRRFELRPGSRRPPGTDLRMRGLAMSDTTESNDERPCLHCLIGDVIDDFYAEYGSLSGEKDTIDVDEIITALAKTVAEMTFGSDDALRRRILEDLMREISQFEEEFANAPASDVRH